MNMSGTFPQNCEDHSIKTVCIQTANIYYKVFHALEKGLLQNKTHPGSMLDAAFENCVLYSEKDRMTF
jgi:hypothetical protein